MSEELALGTLTDTVRRLRAGEVSSSEITQACLARIDRLAARLNCFIEVRADAAMAQARAADAARSRGEPLGALHGIPLAHKDLFYRAGERCTCGSKIRRDYRPQTTATVLERLDTAGALHVGALNMSEFAFGPTGHNHHYGPCRNPWSPHHISGGSSSGSGAAVSASLVFGALGSDTGGSVRLPAAACGVVGIKPTQTRVSRFGVMGLSFSLDNVGPLARTVADCAALLGVIAGHDPRDGTSARQPVPDYVGATRDSDIRGVRVAVPENYYFDLVTPDTRAAFDAALSTLTGLGAELVAVTVPDHDHLAHLSSAINTSEAAALHGDWLRSRGEDYGPQVRARILPGLGYPATHYLQALHTRASILQRFEAAVFAEADVMFAPTVSFPIPTLAEGDVGARPGFQRFLSRLGHCTAPVNYLTCPSIAVPGDLVDGLPTSFQLVGPPFAEARLFRVAAAYESQTRFSARRPPEASAG